VALAGGAVEQVSTHNSACCRLCYTRGVYGGSPGGGLARQREHEI
jgi:hypothetical protein